MFSYLFRIFARFLYKRFIARLILNIFFYFFKSVTDVCKFLLKLFKSFHQQFQALNDLFILESGSLAVLALVSFFIIPLILAQKVALLLFLTFLLGAFRSEPGFSLSYDLRPFSLSPPDLFLPALRVHAAPSSTELGARS